MIVFQKTRAVAAALGSLVLVGTSSCAVADIKDYAFQIVEKAVKVGPGTVISVRLLNRKTGQLVPDAVIIAKRLDMAPAGMEDMAVKIAPLPASDPGVYRFTANVSMAGGWRLSLGAKVQGEDGTVADTLFFKADE